MVAHVDQSSYVHRGIRPIAVLCERFPNMIVDQLLPGQSSSLQQDNEQSYSMAEQRYNARYCR